MAWLVIALFADSSKIKLLSKYTFDSVGVVIYKFPFLSAEILLLK